MLTIGQMARCHALSTKTLRHYDRIGLFRPALTGQDRCAYRHFGVGFRQPSAKRWAYGHGSFIRSIWS